jgi:hypothetical protein
MGGVEGLLSLLAEAVNGLTRARHPAFAPVHSDQVLPIAVADDEAPPVQRGSASSTDQGGGKRRAGMGPVYYREGGSDCRWLAQFHRYEIFPSCEGREPNCE